MKKAGTDPKVKKTLVRNYEQKIRKERNQVIHDVDATSSKASKCSHSKENDLDHPSLCSSEVLAKYLGDSKKSFPLLQTEDLNIDKGQMTKKLNFHFNDRIYKNLVELNADTESSKTKMDKKCLKPSRVNKDLEPNIEDFCESDDDEDTIPTIPVTTPKFKPIQQVENGYLHKLVASFEVL